MTTKTKAEPCPECGQTDWTFDATGIYCRCGYIRERLKRKERGEQQGFMSLAALREAERAEAPEGWYAAQLAAEEEHLGKLEAAFEANCDLSKSWSKDDVRWNQLWELKARHAYQAESVEMLRRTGRPLACPAHGPRGVSGEWKAAGLDLRYCPRCWPGLDRETRRYVEAVR